VTEGDRDRISAQLAEADVQLDQAYISGSGVDEALERAKRLSAELGRAPEIEEAKLRLARRQGLTPSEAYMQLVQISQRENRKLRDAARDLLT
jgi:AmiR/NasT family two-component response regulator